MFVRIMAEKELRARAGVSWTRLLQDVVFIMCFLIVPAAVHAQTYYVDAAAGNDASSGLSPAAPWKSIGKVNGSTFQPGDAVLFRSGCIWREMLIIPSSGTAGNPITFGAYGTGAKPLISGADIVGARGWSLYSGKIFVANVSGIGATPTQLYVDGTYCDMAHYPNSGYLLATANSSDLYTITDRNLSLTVDKVAGATVVARDVPWLIDTSTATALNLMTRTMTLKTALSSAMRAGYGFYLQNKLWMLDSPTEWYFDPRAGRLYLWTSGGDIPNGSMVEVSNRSYGIIDAAKHHIVIRGLAIAAANRYDVYVSGASSVTLEACEISGGQVGVYLTNTSNSAIRNNLLRNTLSTGIMTDWNSVNNVELSNNVVSNAGNVGTIPKSSLASIYVSGTNVNVLNNTVFNSGHVGISMGGSYIVVKNNVIDGSCLVLDDCAGIYAISNGISKAIIGNAVSNSRGNFSGTAYRTTQAHGIYLDDFAHDVSVSDNIVSNADYGIFIHTGYNNAVTGNKVYSTRINGLLINENSDGAVAGTVHGNLVDNNTFETLSAGATACFYSTKGTTAGFGTFDRNRYCHPNSVFAVRDQNRNYVLPAWQQASGQDLNSIEINEHCAVPSPAVTLSAVPAAVASGGTVTLTWSSTNAASCVAGGAWSGAKPASGSLSIGNLTGSGTYALTCSGQGGAVTGVTTVTVE